jgi:hypothetical protein
VFGEAWLEVFKGAEVALQGRLLHLQAANQQVWRSQERQSQSQTSLETRHLRVVFPPPVGWQGLCKLWVQIRIRTVVQMQGRYPFLEM